MPMNLGFGDSLLYALVVAAAMLVLILTGKVVFDIAKRIWK